MDKKSFLASGAVLLSFGGLYYLYRRSGQAEEKKKTAALPPNIASICFGRAIREELFSLDKDGWRFLNHGSYGALPKYVTAKQRELQDQLEHNPDLWFRDLIYGQCRTVLKRVAPMVNTVPENLVFVPNATTAMNAVTQSFEHKLKEGDNVLFLDLIYPAVKNAVLDMCNKAKAKTIQVQVTLPLTGAKQIVDAVQKALDENDNIKIAFFDHITSSTALVLPIKELTAICKKKNKDMLVAIDGAHSIGQVPIDLKDIDCDFFCSNFHKWLYSPKGSAFLYSKKEHQTWLQPVVTSHFWQHADWTQRFNMQGTNDGTAFLGVGAALDFIDGVGVDRAHQYRKTLLTNSVQLFKQRWPETFELIAPLDMCGYMVTFKIPVPETETEKKKVNEQKVADAPHATVRSEWLMNKLMREHKMIVPINSYKGQLWARLASQIYIGEEDVVAFVDLICELVKNKAWEKDPAAGR